jgi:Rieske Fe-S protein
MSDTGSNRRHFLSLLTKLLFTSLGLSVVVPAFAYVWSPLRRKREEKGSDGGFVDVGSLTDLPMGEWRLLTLEVVREDGWEKTRSRHALWVCRQGEDGRSIAVLSPICPHLGCPINWHPDRSQFSCPCHGGIFDTGGRHISGPPPRAMDALDYEVRAGRLWVRWQDFKIGVADRVPVSG